MSENEVPKIYRVSQKGHTFKTNRNIRKYLGVAYNRKDLDNRFLTLGLGHHNLNLLRSMPYADFDAMKAHAISYAQLVF